MRTGILLGFSMILLLMGVSLVFSIYGGALSVGQARQYHRSVMTRLERASFDEEECQKYQKKAREDHYELSLEKVKKQGESMEKVTLSGRLSFPFLKEEKTYQISGYSLLQGGGES